MTSTSARVKTLLLASTFAAQALSVSAVAGEAPCLHIRGGVVWLEDGPVSGLELRIEGTRIAAVGPSVDPGGCERIDASASVITPGFVDPHSELGLSEIGLEPTTVDRQAAPDAVGPLAIRPGFLVRDAVNPLSSAIAVTRLGGVTSVLATPAGGLVSGTGAWLDLAGDTQREMVRRSRVAIHGGLAGGDVSRADAFFWLNALFDEARDFSTRQPDWERNRARPYRFAPEELRAMAPVVRGEVPFVVSADRAADIEALLRLAERLGIKLVIASGAEAWLHAQRLSEWHVPVIVDGLLDSPETFDRLRARPDNAALLARAGVPVMLGTFGYNVRSLRQVAGNAIRAGLDPEVAMAALTHVPADVFGMSDHGRIAAGARANLVQWSGDPFELATAVQRVIVAGKQQPLVSRQTLLRDRYRRLPGTPPALPLPIAPTAAPNR